MCLDMPLTDVIPCNQSFSICGGSSARELVICKVCIPTQIDRYVPMTITSLAPTCSRGGWVCGGIAEIGATGYDRSTTTGTNDGFVARFWIGVGEGY